MIEPTHTDPPLKGYDGRTIELPKRLFKFMKTEHAVKMCSFGSFRIGTLYEFRDADIYGYGVLDRHEAELEHTEQITFARPHQLTQASQSFLAAARLAGPGVTLQNVEIDVNMSEQDSYLYCTSLSDSWDSDIDPRYKTCVEIFDPLGFFHGLRNHLIRRRLCYPNFDVGRVRYGDRVHTTFTQGNQHTNPLDCPISFIKPVELESQQEYRFIFDALADKIEPVLGSSHKIKRCCRIHSYRG